MRDGLAIAVPGVLIGAACAWAMARLVRAQLYGIAPGDPRTLLAGAAILLAVALAASLVPALRASRVAPVEALRGGVTFRATTHFHRHQQGDRGGYKRSALPTQINARSRRNLCGEVSLAAREGLRRDDDRDAPVNLASGLHADFHVVAESGQEFHQAFGGEGSGAPVQQVGDVRLRNA